MGVEQHAAEDALVLLGADLQLGLALARGKNRAGGTLIGHVSYPVRELPGTIATGR
jgi:hypothetical protein